MMLCAEVPYKLSVLMGREGSKPPVEDITAQRFLQLEMLFRLLLQACGSGLIWKVLLKSPGKS